MNKQYKVVSTAFIQKGGDGFQSLTLGTIQAHEKNYVLVSEVLEEELSRRKNVSVQLEARIQIANKSASSSPYLKKKKSESSSNHH